MNSGLNISSGAEEKKINENLDINNHYNGSFVHILHYIFF